jgi:hypothetical protein
VFLHALLASFLLFQQFHFPRRVAASHSLARFRQHILSVRFDALTRQDFTSRLGLNHRHKLLAGKHGVQLLTHGSSLGLHPIAMTDKGERFYHLSIQQYFNLVQIRSNQVVGVTRVTRTRIQRAKACCYRLFKRKGETEEEEEDETPVQGACLLDAGGGQLTRLKRERYEESVVRTLSWS